MARGYSFNLKLTDYTDEIEALEEGALETLLEAIGLEAEGDVVIGMSSPGWIPKEPIDTGNLKNSITHRVVPSEGAVYIGTDVEYAPYVEFGTGKFAEGASHAKTIPWHYKDDEGRWHTTSGMPPRPFLRTAIRKNIRKYKWIAEDALYSAFHD